MDGHLQEFRSNHRIITRQEFMEMTENINLVDLEALAPLYSAR